MGDHSRQKGQPRRKPGSAWRRYEQIGQGGPAQLREVAGTPSAKGRPKKVTYKTFMYCIYNEGKGYLYRGRWRILQALMEGLQRSSIRHLFYSSILFILV